MNLLKYKDIEIPYSIKNSKKLKHLYIVIEPYRGVVIKNPCFSKTKIEEILKLKSEWIYKKYRELENRLFIKEIYEKEKKILLLGEKLSLNIENLEKFYKEKTKEIVDKEMYLLSKKLNLYPTRVIFRKTKKRWGSCNHKNEISFTITLAQLPIECIRYIIVHELVHIKHKNHKKEFYKMVKNHIPEYKKIEKVIKNYSPMV